MPLSRPPRSPLTHFLCIPLLTPTSKPTLKTSLSHFRTTVTSLRSPELPNGILAHAVRPLGTLHLTLGVMSLTTPEMVQEALGLLRGLDLRRLMRGVSAKKDEKEGDEVVERENLEPEDDHQPLKFSLKGLESMHEPSNTSILYAAPYDPTRRLQSFCERLREVFVERESMNKEDRPLLLHATIVNMVYVKGGRPAGGRRGGHGKHKARLRLDAREVLEIFGDFEWAGDMRVEKVAICRMGAKKVDGRDGEGGDEEYVVEGEVEMPM